jgi:hypothetical protein
MPYVYPKPGIMVTRTPKAAASTIDNRIGILGTNATEASPTKQVFGTVTAILVLVRVSVLVLRPSANSH